MGRWSARHRKRSIFGWLAFVLVAFVVGTFVVGAKQSTDATGPGESGRANAILEEGFKQPAGESVLIQSETLQAEAPAFVAAIRDVVEALEAEGAVMNIRSPLATENAGQISRTDARRSSTSRSAETPISPPRRLIRFLPPWPACRRRIPSSSSASSGTQASTRSSRALS
jgi:hypothetical protein